MMRLKVESTSKDAKKLKEKFVALASSVESENWDSGEITLVLEIILQKIYKKKKCINLCYFLDTTY